MASGLAPLLEEGDGFGTGQRIEPVERFVEDDDLRIVRGGLGEFGALAHAFGVGGNGAVAGFHEADSFERSHGALAAAAAKAGAAGATNLPALFCISA